MKTPTWKATQNQMLVDTAQTVPCSARRRNRKASVATTLMSPCSRSMPAVATALCRRSRLSPDHERSSSASETGSVANFLSPTSAFFVACPTRMDAELEKLVESGKLTARAADQLEKLKPGTYCLHKSWGFGRVAEWNLLLNQILIDFPGKKAHGMQLTYAAENLTVIPPEHFLAKKANDLKSIKELVKKDPAALDAEHSREPGRLRHRDANQPADARRYFHRARMETLVGFDEEALEQGRLFPHSSQEERADRIAGAKRFRGRTN